MLKRGLWWRPEIGDKDILLKEQNGLAGRDTARCTDKSGDYSYVLEVKETFVDDLSKLHLTQSTTTSNRRENSLQADRILPSP